MAEDSTGGVKPADNMLRRESLNGTVTVACKLPHGLHLQLPGHPRVTVRGNAEPRGADLVNYRGKPIEAGYALTHGVDAAFWAQWLKLHEKMDIVAKGFIFAHAQTQSVKSHAREYEGLMSGLEPIDPDKPGKGLERLVVAG